MCGDLLMDTSAVLARVTDIVRDTLDDDDILLSPDTVASNVPGWDSLAHIRIMVAVEQAFHIRLKTDQITSLKDVGGLVDLIVQATSS